MQWFRVEVGLCSGILFLGSLYGRNIELSAAKNLNVGINSKHLYWMLYTQNSLLLALHPGRIFRERKQNNCPSEFSFYLLDKRPGPWRQIVYKIFGGN